MFVHLRVKTDFSLLNSTITIEKLSNFVKSNEVKALCLMDDGNLSGSLEFSTKISKCGVKPLIGVNIKFIDNTKVLNDAVRTPDLGLIAMNLTGYKNILKILKKAEFSDNRDKNGKIYITLDDLKSLDASDIICLSGGYDGLISYYVRNGDNQNAEMLCETLNSIFEDRFYIELSRFGWKDEVQIENFLIDSAYKYNIPLVATNDARFMKSQDFDAYDVLTCIGSGDLVHNENRQKLNSNYYLKTESEMKELFSDIPEAIENTVNIAKRCNFFVKGSKPILPPFLPEGEDENEFLIQKAKAGLEEIIVKHNIQNPEKYRERLEFELKIIIGMGFPGYFLIVSDFISWAKEQKIPVGPGRGSGAGSIVAWSLKITGVDPIKYGLLFERFLNPDRVSMPDFDIDFCQRRREEVIEYVKNRYGVEKISSIITFGKLQAKAALKDVGRVMQMSYNMVDNLCKMIPFSPLEPITIKKAIEMDDRLQQQIEEDPEINNLVTIAMEVEGLARHTSTHAAGIIIGGVDLVEIAPIQKDENSDVQILAFNMKDAEKIGLLKFDFLGLKTLSVVDEICKLVKQNRNTEIDIDTIDLHDEKTLKLLESSKLKGVFQLESSAPRNALSSIKVDGVEDLTAITSLNRPGPMEFIPSYIRRKNGVEAVEYPDKILESVLKETFGIIIYQEQVMQTAQIVAKYTLAQADLLRRAMGKKIKEEMDQQLETFVAGAKENGFTEEKAREIFALVDKFAGYGFNKSHALAYSVISYQTAYLKANYPIEFYVANLNLEINDTDKLNEFIADAKKMQIPIILPNINKSCGYFTTSEDNKSIIYSLGALKSVGLNSALSIEQIRKEQGDFVDIFDFAKKVGHKICNKKQLESLIGCGAFDELHKNRRQLFESVEIITGYASSLGNEKNSSASLFGEEEMNIAPKLKVVIIDYDDRMKLDLDMQYIGFYLSSHPLLKYTDIVEHNKISKSSDLESITDKRKTIQMVGVVTKITQRFRKGSRFCFVSIADLEGIFEVAIFNSDLILQARDLLVEGRLNWFEISASKDDSGLRLIVNEIKDIEDVKLKFAETGKKKDETVKQQSKTTTYSETKVVNSPVVNKNYQLIKPKTDNYFNGGDIKPDSSQSCAVSNGAFLDSANVAEKAIITADKIITNIKDGEVFIKIKNIKELQRFKKILKNIKSETGSKIFVLFYEKEIELKGRYNVESLKFYL